MSLHQSLPVNEGVVVTVVVAFVIYVANKKRETLLWWISNIYAPISDELLCLVESDEFPGEPGDRTSHSKLFSLPWYYRRLLHNKTSGSVPQYRQSLSDLEEAEQRLQDVIPKLESAFPHVLCDSSQTEFNVVVDGVADEQLYQDLGDSGPKFSQITSSRAFELLFSGVDLDIFEVESPHEVREILTPDDDEPGEIDLTKPTLQLGADNLTHRNIAFWDENLPNWEQILYDLITSGTVKEYLDAKLLQEKSEELLRQAGSELWNQIEEDSRADIQYRQDSSPKETES